MKAKTLFLIGCLVLLSSCSIVKSLKAFYIPKAVEFQESFVGEWKDKKDKTWRIISFKNAFQEEMKNEKLTESDSLLFSKYKEGYFVQYGSEDSEPVFLAMPFRIDETVFMDFTPFDFKLLKGQGSLMKQHLIKTHSVAKFNTLKDGSIKLTWLDEDRLGTLFENQKIQIKHEIVGFDEALLLTASSEELYRFLKKYNASTIEDKWKSDEELVLTASNAKP